MAAPFRVKAIYDYSSPHEDDLNFAVGQLITVTHQEDDDWYSGEYVDEQGVARKGIFPRNFVDRFEPTAPPRPTRARAKREPEVSQSHSALQATAPPHPPLHDAIPAKHTHDTDSQPQLEPQSQPRPDQADLDAAVPSLRPSADATSPPPAAAEPLAVSASAPHLTSPTLAPHTSAPAPPSSSSSAPRPAESPASSPPSVSKPKFSGPPPVSEKPTSNSFKDRIAAFNKPAAPPIAPFHPGGSSTAGSGFVRKPFVAPPPSRNAYVPPPKEAPSPTVYRRDEDPEIKEAEAENQDQAEKAGLLPADTQRAEGGDAQDDDPKPTSLKERIALLQKQQMEQAQRHADAAAAAKKEKPKRPPKKRNEALTQPDAAPPLSDAALSPLERKTTDESAPRTSTDEGRPARGPPASRRRPSKGHPTEVIHDGNEADLSGAADTTEEFDAITEREDSDELSLRASRAPPGPVQDEHDEENGEDDDDDIEQNADEAGEDVDDDVDPEVRRKEELRARMAKMSGGMGFHGMFGSPPPMPAPAGGPKKKPPKPATETPALGSADDTGPISRAVPPIPTPMALPGMGGGPLRPEKSASPEDEDKKAADDTSPTAPTLSQRSIVEVDNDGHGAEASSVMSGSPSNRIPVPPGRSIHEPPPPVPEASRPAPPPIPSGSHSGRPPPPPPPPPPTSSADAKSPSEGSESDDELSGGGREDTRHIRSLPRSPPMPPAPLQTTGFSTRSPPVSPHPDALSPTSPQSSAANRRISRQPPPIPGATTVPPAGLMRPPPPPPPRTDASATTPKLSHLQAGNDGGLDDEDEVTEYEGDYDTDMASSVPHKDALKAQVHESSSQEDNSLHSPTGEMPASQAHSVPIASPPRAMPPPIPTQMTTEAEGRRSVEAPRLAPPPPPAVPAPPQKEATAWSQQEDEYDPYNYAKPASSPSVGTAFSRRTVRTDEEAQIESHVVSSPERRAPAAGRSSHRQSQEMPRMSMGNRPSTELHRPSMESDFIASRIDLAPESGWWKQANQLPPALQGRQDLLFEGDESATTNKGSKTVVTRTISILFQDYSQTLLTIRYDPHDSASEVKLEQHHEAPPRAPRQDQMEDIWDRFGRHLAMAIGSKKDTVVGDGSPQGLIHELLRPLKDALWPVGRRSYGALVYANMANASTLQHDVIRPGDIMLIRNAKFQGKHGPMHAKYAVEVGKPDHVALVAEWDGTKKKVRAWEQGRESRKVKLESFKLDDLRSGEVKIWRVVPRSWVGWGPKSTPL